MHASEENRKQFKTSFINFSNKKQQKYIDLFVYRIRESLTVHKHKIGILLKELE